MKAVYILGIVLSILFLFVIGYFIEEVQSARYSSLYNYEYVGGYDNYNNSYYDNGSDQTFIGAIVSFFFFTFFIFVGIVGLIKVKTSSNKVISIIGLSLSTIFFFWNILVMISPGSLSYNEVGGGFGFYSIVMLAFMIVGLVQAIRFSKREISADLDITNGDLLDS